MFDTNRYRSSMRYNNLNLTWNNQWESRRLSLSFTCKLGSGNTHSSRSGGGAEEEGRSGN